MRIIGTFFKNRIMGEKKHNLSGPSHCFASLKSAIGHLDRQGLSSISTSMDTSVGSQKKD